MKKYYPKPVTKLSIQKILSQLNNSFCLIDDKSLFNAPGIFLESIIKIKLFIY